MKRFMVYAARHKGLYLIAFLMLFGGIALDAVIPSFVRKLVDDVMIGQKTGELMTLLLSMLGCFVLRGVTDYLQEFSSDKVGWKVAEDARVDLFEHIEGEDQTFFRENTPGELMSRVKRDTESVGTTFGFIGIFMIQIIIHVIVMLACLARLSLPMALVCIVLMPFIAVLGYKGEKKGDALYGDISEETATMNKTAGEAISGIRTVKAFNKEEHEKKRFEKRNKHFFDLSVRLEWMFGNCDAGVSFLGRAMLFLSILAGGLLVISKKMSLGTLASSVEYVNNLVWPMMEIGWILNEISSAMASSKKIDNIFKRKSRLTEGTIDSVADDELVFSHVGLNLEDTMILDDISFTVSSGKTLGIMGATGSGKSTITNLALRFLDPTSGTILLGGRPSTDYTFHALRSAFSIVTQDIFLFSDTAMNNIKIGNPDMSDQIAMHAAASAKADGFITHLEEGYSTVIGEKGVGLSGGQKQRLCIARALAKNAPILILDDSTSALDMETEREIQHELHALEHKQSTIIVAHRISAVRRADEIIYLDRGRIVERGTHQSLMAMHGRYYETFVAQYSKEDADGSK
ncbi:MAG: ABC transporter ATP-binding protein [Sphaerochaetaceae bacterium]|jgi:ATP-binding cassette subfamily B multidrug efflux pump|nr:ABC transporter ATP-binding protein [Sphaerochaetaceae bacterium]MDD3162809.1 ABC transporter ATP-binding protein [Sphaerochaetaceae bacterium]MDD4006866.1 ABC transporter ATP-binding protein [Sphaerochaetaceae bacterium]MDD4395998.1 ABC transporter ATP-binding protein [Sphaerochaetaceae bacterium]